MEESRRTLYIGAHPDDVTIGASIAINRNPERSRVLTVSSGVALDQEWPVEVGEITFRSPSEYEGARLAEDKAAMRILGIDIDNNYFNGDIPDQQSYLYLEEIYKLINRLVDSNEIERIVTHSLPEAHPDHEVVSLCSHLVGQRKEIPILEYPLYVLGSDGKKIDQEFLEGDSEKVFILNYSPDEIAIRERVLSAYGTQGFVNNRFGRNSSESFRLVSRDLGDMPLGTGYYYRDEPGLPTPADVRTAMKNFEASL